MSDRAIDVGDRLPEEALRRVVRVTKEEAAAPADTEPTIASWLERIAAGISKENHRLFPHEAMPTRTRISPGWPMSTCRCTCRR